MWQGLNIYSGVTSLDLKLKDTANASTSNKQVVGVPKVQANLLAEYSCRPYRNGFTALTSLYGQTRGERSNTSYASSYTHMGFGNALHHESEQRPNHFPRGGNNVFDKHYWLLSSHQVPMAITVLVRLSAAAACIIVTFD